jgi:hypothetical protein
VLLLVSVTLPVQLHMTLLHRLVVCGLGSEVSCDVPLCYGVWWWIGLWRRVAALNQPAACDRVLSLALSNGTLYCSTQHIADGAAAKVLCYFHVMTPLNALSLLLPCAALSMQLVAFQSFVGPQLGNRT